ncbi:ArnT family glycosyltransferase [Nocardia alni]|uniref:ArnT family glycosyltransferase n=1 Tax=Nocardia alni TaxID=2815723 RepID=UPI001C221EFF|nr:glycosyltransferase family 39 protein [Nocardia alni]
MVSIGISKGAVNDVGVARELPVTTGDEKRWALPGLAGLLVATAVLYLWGLRSAGWTNPFYAAAVQSGTKSWKALLFASLDPGNSITVDKPPADMWLMALSGRMFGFSAWSMLLPQALLGVATVALVYGAVRRLNGPGAGLLAGAAMASTPVAAVMFRYANPDALMMFLVVAAAYCVVRALRANPVSAVRWRSASTGWLVVAGVAIGLGFLAKMMQAFLVLPGLALVVLIAMPGGFWSRIAKLVTAGLAVLVSAGWYVALVQLWPANSRPFIGGSTTNSLWELAVGYNGLGRILGRKQHRAPTHPAARATAHAAATHTPAHFGGMTGGQTGLTRLLQPSLATEFSWLVPVAVIGLVAGLWLTRRGPRTEANRAALILWGGWLVGTWLVLSYMSSSFHTYYTIELAPAIAALGAIGATLLWRRREHLGARLTLGAMSAATGAWVFYLLGQTPHWLPWLRWTLLVGGVVAAALLAALGGIGVRAGSGDGGRTARRAAAVIAAVALAFGIAAPAAYAVETVAVPHSGGSPYSGPIRVRGNGGWHGNGESGGSTPRLDAMLSAARNRWAAAAVGSQQVSSIELRTGASLMAIGGFSGRDPSPTLAQFQQNVAGGDVHYFLATARTSKGRDDTSDTAAPSASGTHTGATGSHAAGTHGRNADTLEQKGIGPAQNAGGGGGGGSDASTSAGQITAWVQAHYAPTTVDGVQVYDLTVAPGV